MILTVAGEVDILVTNAGGPPPGIWSDWDRDDFIAALDANMLTPIALMKACLPGMIARGWGRVVNITSQSAVRPLQFWAGRWRRALASLDMWRERHAKLQKKVLISIIYYLEFMQQIERFP